MSNTTKSWCGLEAIFNKKIFFKVVFFVLFFVITAAIMAVSILVIYKLSDALGCGLSLSSLVMCGVAALLINFSVITVTPFLTKSYYYTLGGMIVFAALGTTCYNKYLLYRHRAPTLAGAEMVSHELADEVMLPLEPAAAEPEVTAEAAVEPTPRELEPVIESKELANPPLTELPEPIAAIVAELAQGDGPEPQAERAAEAAAVNETQAEQDGTVTTDILAAQAPELPIGTAAEPEFVDEPAPAEPIPEPMAQPDTIALTDTASASVSQLTSEATTEYEADKAIPEPPTAEAEDSTVEAAAEEVMAEETAEAQLEEAIPAAEPEEPATEPVPESFARQLAAMKTLDHLLDYAFERNSHNRKQQAIWTYEAALERYGDDAYAPFVVIEMVNIHKSLGHYQAAINCLSAAMELPAVAANPGMQQQFQDNLLYLSSVKQVLDKSHQKNLPLSQISKDSMLEIESLYKQSKSR